MDVVLDLLAYSGATGWIVRKTALPARTCLSDAAACIAEARLATPGLTLHSVDLTLWSDPGDASVGRHRGDWWVTWQYPSPSWALL